MTIPMGKDPPSLLAEAVILLTEAGIDNPRLDARILVGAVTGLEPTEVGLARGQGVVDAQRRGLARLLARRMTHEPVSRILGRREFWSLDFFLSPATLDPRPDSETLVEAVLRDLDQRGIAHSTSLRLLDLGTGTGCLPLALLSELPTASAVGVDRAEDAARTARHNADALGLADRFQVLVGDWSDALGGRFDWVLSNPPYIPTTDLADLAPEVGFDPLLALDGGADGLTAYRRIIAELPRLLMPNGAVALEVGWDQAMAVTGLLQAAGLRVAPPIRDLGGRDRVLIAHLS